MYLMRIAYRIQKSSKKSESYRVVVERERMSTNDDDDDVLPKGWSRHESKSRPGVFYYMNKYTGTSVWKRPTRPATKRDREEDGGARNKGVKRVKRDEDDGSIQCHHILVKHAQVLDPDRFFLFSFASTRSAWIRPRAHINLRMFFSPVCFDVYLNAYICTQS